MSHALTGATLKLQRANANLDALKKAIKGSREQYPHRYLTYIDQDAGACIFAVQLDPPPVLWAPMIGDVLHNIHSALDHLIWELIRHRNYNIAPPPEIRATFPIFANRGRFWAKSKKGKGKRRWTTRSGATTLFQIPSDARRIMLEVQPYKDRHRDHPLWHLYSLSNADKHQTLHYAHHAVVDGAVRVVAMRNVRVRSFAPRSGPVIPGRPHVIGVMQFEVTGEDPEFQIKPQFTFQEAFAKDTPASDLPLIKVLDEIMQFVVQEVFAERFWPYFGADPVNEITLIREHAKTYAEKGGASTET